MTTQNVACPITIVQYDRLVPQKAKNELSAMPVMIPGSAIGRTSSQEIASRPKKRKRESPKAAADPSNTGAGAAPRAAPNGSQSAPRLSRVLHGYENQIAAGRQGGQPPEGAGLETKGE